MKSECHFDNEIKKMIRSQPKEARFEIIDVAADERNTK
jgi:hypothetical protein